MPKVMERPTYQESMKGEKTRQLSTAFPPVWTPEKEGEFIKALYVGSELANPKGVETGFMAHNFALIAWNGTFTRSKKDYTPTEGEIISISGDLMTRALKTVAVGSKLGIVFSGYAERTSKTRNPAKLFEVELIEG